jgi:nucleotide-binding universal stress UspA family protein
MKILIGVDDSQFSEQAVDFVAGMPWPPGSTVIVAFAVQIPVPATFGAVAQPGLDIPALIVESTRAGQQVVERQAKPLRKAEIPFETRVSEGDPRLALAELVRDERIDLLVIGSHGRTGLTKLIMGGVASHLVAHAPCSVLVVKPRLK